MTRYPDTKQIRSKLKSGDTIDNVCREYDLTLVDLLFHMRRLGDEKDNKKFCTGQKNRSTGHKYISQHTTGRYIIRNNRKHFGTYRTLEDALKIRDWFICNRWDKRWVDRACRECGVERCRK